MNEETLKVLKTLVKVLKALLAAINSAFGVAAK